MKKVLLSLSVLALSLLSCNKDDSSSESSSGNQNLANAQNATEEAAIPLAVLESGIKIEGANKINGQAPAVNSDLAFTLESNEQEAFQDSGLDIKFSASGNISGAYIQFKDVDGNASGNYFDVPASAFISEFDSRKSLNIFKTNHSSAKVISQNFSVSPVQPDEGFDNNNNRGVINIDFENVPAGQFCYDICLYDGDQNVYVIQEVCVEVEAWGGNSSIVGVWEFNRIVNNFEEASDDQIFDEEGLSTIICDSGETLTYDSNNQTKDDKPYVLTLNEDGTYLETDSGSYSFLNYLETTKTCTVVFEESTDFSYKYSGNWAFNEDNNTLTIIDFKYEDLLDPSKNTEYPDGELYFDGVEAEVINGELKLGDQEGTIEAFFTRK